MVRAMVLSSFLVASMAFVFAVVAVKRNRTPDTPDGVRLPEPPIVPLPVPAAAPAPAPAPPLLAEPLLAEPSLAEPLLAEPLLAEPSIAEPSYTPPAPPVRPLRAGRNSGFARFTPIEGSSSVTARH
jgi:hypothetical protein